MTARAAAYLRKSRSDDPTREISRAVQERSVRSLAARDGHADLALYVDWDRSADESKAARRTEFNRLVRAIEAGEVSVLYAYAADRLYRSLETFIRLTGAAERHGVRIVTERDGVIGGDGSPMSQFQAGLGALVGRLELSTAKARAKSAYEARVARGDRIGRPPYGWRLVKDDAGVVVQVADPEHPLEPIFNAYVRAGKRVRRAVRIINDELRIPAPHGGLWDRSSLLRIIGRERPDLLPSPTANGQRAAAADSPAKLSKLLMCHCGRLLTPNRKTDRRRARPSYSISYYCARGLASRTDHPRVYVAESTLLPWVEEELTRYDEPQAEPTKPARDTDAERAALLARRARDVQMRSDGLIDRDEVRRRVAAIDRDLAALQAPPPPRGLPRTWTHWTDAEYNERVRSLLDHVTLDEMLLPIEAAWHDPAWRYEGPGLPPSVRVELEELKRQSIADHLAERRGSGV